MTENPIKWNTIVKYGIYLSNPRAEKKLSKSNVQKELDKRKHLNLTNGNPDIKQHR